LPHEATRRQIRPGSQEHSGFARYAIDVSVFPAGTFDYEVDLPITDQLFELSEEFDLLKQSS
jgi:hypothetical protein